EDEVLVRFFRNLRVGLLDLALEHLDVDVYFDSHRISLSFSAWTGGPIPGSSPLAVSSFSPASSVGSPAAFQPANPPTMSVDVCQPSSRRVAAAKLEEKPCAQKTITLCPGRTWGLE